MNPSTQRQSEWRCSFCTKQLKSETSLRRHGVLRHSFDFSTQMKATKEVLIQFRTKAAKSKLTLAVASIATDEGHTDDGESSITSKLVPSDVEADSDDDDVAITTVEAPPPVIPDPTARKDTKPVKIDLKPKPVTDVTVPCQRRQYEIQAQKAATTLPTSKLRASELSTIKTQPIPPPKKKSKIPEGVAWPRRHLCPPISDIIEYRKDMSPAITAEEVGEAAAEYFAWTDQPVISCATYVTTVLNSLDRGKRTTLDTLSMYLAEEPTTIEEARRKWSAIKHWAKTEYPPKTSQRWTD